MLEEDGMFVLGFCGEEEWDKDEFWSDINLLGTLQTFLSTFLNFTDFGSLATLHMFMSKHFNDTTTVNI